MSVNLKSLIGKLNDATRSALEGAAGLCLSRTHYDIELEHYLTKLLDQTDGDAARIFRHFGVDASRLNAELTRSLDKLKSGNARTPSLSPSVLKMMTDAWLLASVDFGWAEVRTGLTVLAMLTNEELARIVREVSKELQKIQTDALRKEFLSIVSGSHEGAAGAAPADARSPEQVRAAGGKTPNLDQYTVDLTARARAGKIDPVLGRDFEIRQVIDILMRRRQNNPILTGEAGVGKTAVVEGFAIRIAQGDVPPSLKNVILRTLDLALLQAGAGIKGEFENRLKGLIEEVKASPTPIILFIDEAHTMIGAGGQAGQNDAANLLKPALARGELRTIAATTWSEYKKFFEKDAALARRFQVVKVEEPTEAQCMVMLRGIASNLEAHHGVRILDEGLASAVKFSHRYLAGRQLPDKAVSVLDTACARLALGQNSIPAAIEDAHRQIDDLIVQERVLRREAAVGADHAERLEEIARKQAETQQRLASLEQRYEKEKDLVERVRKIRLELEGSPGGAQSSDGGGAAAQPAKDPEALRSELALLNTELDALQGEAPLMRVCVDSHIVGEVISAWTGIPVGKMMKDEISTVLELPTHLGSRVIGQGHALDAISQRIRTSRARLEDPNKPIGVFLLVGPSGVGKTETALALADLLYGGERNLVTINMSEFQEAHTVSTLKGSPPGYVGYGEGGVLTEAVRRRPYSVVLLDEVEKAHPDVLELFFQVFDKGMMEDGEGREIDFKNTIIILTSNAGTDTLMKLTADPETMPDSEGLVKALKPELNKIFKPAFLGRLVIIPYFPIRDEAMKRIIVLKLGKIQRRIQENHKITLGYDDAVVDEVANRCTEVESGARNVDNILTNTLLPEISRQLLARMAAGEKLSSIRVGIGDGGSFVYS
ncbi:MAG: type VI secretion system ATPase TssH [Bryobacteraceae bacterium]|nr:type VI secretion system ATPase TssH [Bryobacterales bacterium]MEB2360128.1 type VI secretion system ATPase TssH [Bryobacterales bacterium]NUN00535.1 type VI secretion system ATPase TssH [Bryobacteraceae bacterium]